MARRFRRRIVIVVLACAFAFTWLGWIVHDLGSRGDREQQRADQASQAATQACDQLLQLGYPCPFDPAQFRGETGATGPAGRAPTEAEIAAAVSVYLAGHPAAPGPAPTQAEIAAAVTIYLLANPAPAGEQGPAPTAEQILAAVQTYLLANPLPVCPAGSHIEEYKPKTDRRTFLVCVKETPQPQRS